ncbi:hypothetical protein SAV14893_061940 [Streptomyces avermitilis]|uniref:Luciferase-like domain-containing protein n=1 Tax=Streptomyces avermitilis TaxID=33903 RepID=A0A4D4M4K3_STRAX|nr:hypothetical protein SAV14893_061940 [Streptomyces avermitilis]
MTVRKPAVKQIHLAALPHSHSHSRSRSSGESPVPGVDNTTVWADPRAKSQIEFASFEHLARTAERGLFDFFLLAGGLRLREHKGRIHDLDVVGHPEAITVLNALAAVTERLGLAATVDATFNEPYETARRLATLDHLSGGRAAWNVVTSADAFTGANFRRGGFLDRADRHARTAEFVAAARELWDSWTPEGCRGRSPTVGGTSTSRVSSPCRARRRGTPSSSRPATRPRPGSSPHPRRTWSSPGTGRWRRGARSTLM